MPISRASKPSGSPRLRILFSLGAHYAVVDGKSLVGVAEDFKPDVIVPERAFSTPENEKDATLRVAAMRKLKPGAKNQAIMDHASMFNPVSKGFALAESLLLANTNAVYFHSESWNPQAAEKLTRQLQKLSLFFDQSYDALMNGDVGKALRLHRRCMNADAEAEARRDRNLAENLKSMLPRILERKPDLARRKEIRVLVRLGGYHILPYHLLRGAPGISTELVYDSPMANMPSAEMGLRKSVFGKTPRLTDAQVGRNLLRTFFLTLIGQSALYGSAPVGPGLYDIRHASTRKYELASAYLRRFTDGEILETLEHFRNSPSDAGKAAIFSLRALESKGISPPRSNEELDAQYHKLVVPNWGPARFREPFDVHSFRRRPVATRRSRG
ncbi:MAG: hypothetical protein V1708_04580 [Candidatus Micrarchaeota archaeon]